MPKFKISKQVQGRTGTQDAGAVIIRDIPIGEIITRKNVRSSDNVDIDDLKESIKQAGLLQPITVYKDVDDYVCIMGHRRLTAYKELHKEEADHFHSIPAIITDDRDVTVRQLIENVQRSDLKQIELYHALKELKEQGLSHKQVAEVIGKTEGYIKNLFSAVKEIDSDPENFELLKSDVTSLSDFKAVKPIKDKSEKKKLLQERAENKISQNELRNKVKEAQKKDTPQPPQPQASRGSIINLTANDADRLKIVLRIIVENKMLLKKLTDSDTVLLNKINKMLSEK